MRKSTPENAFAPFDPGGDIFIDFYVEDEEWYAVALRWAFNWFCFGEFVEH